MMVHHDQRSYAEAAEQAAAITRGKMLQQIERGKATAGDLIRRLAAEVPDDRIWMGGDIRFLMTDDRLHVRSAAGEPVPVHRNAIRQIAQAGGLPMVYFNNLTKAPEKDEADRTWKKNLLLHNLQELFSHGDTASSHWLTRSVKKEVRGFLTDRYRPLNSIKLLEAFVEIVQQIGAVPIDTTFDDVRFAFKVSDTDILEPLPNEPILRGVEMKHSDFGAGAFDIRSFIDRLWCTNLATMQSTMREVHLGKRLPSNIVLRPETYEADTKAVSMVAQDTVRGLLGPASKDALVEAVRAAHAQKVEWKELEPKLGKVLLKAEMEKAELSWRELHDKEKLPEENTLWRASNLLSWLAGDVTDIERKLVMQRAAGAMLTGKAIDGEDLTA